MRANADKRIPVFECTHVVDCEKFFQYHPFLHRHLAVTPSLFDKVPVPLVNHD